MFRKIGADLILLGMLLPWAVWVTMGLFASHEVEAVQKSHNAVIIEKLDEIKQDIKELKNGH